MLLSLVRIASNLNGATALNGKYCKWEWFNVATKNCLPFATGII